MIAHSTSAYPCPPQELNLRMVQTLQAQYPNTPIGYSGHETGLSTTVTAVALGASVRGAPLHPRPRHPGAPTMRPAWSPAAWPASCATFRDTEAAMGDGVKVVYESEREPLRRLRRELTARVARGRVSRAVA